MIVATKNLNAERVAGLSGLSFPEQAQPRMAKSFCTSTFHGINMVLAAVPAHL